MSSLSDQIWEAVAPHTMLDRPRADQLNRMCAAMSSRRGDWAEIGVFRGGSALLMSMWTLNGPVPLHLFDTFSGTPLSTVETWEPYFLTPTFDETSLPHVRDLLYGRNNVQYHEGIFPQTWTDDLAAREYSLLHFDADTYQCLRDALQRFWPRLVSGGIVLIDDWGRPETPGIIRAAMEFVAGTHCTLSADPLVHYTAILTKP